MAGSPIYVDNKSVAMSNAASILILGALVTMIILLTLNNMLVLVCFAPFPFLSYWVYRNTFKKVCFYPDRIEFFRSNKLTETVYPPFEKVTINTVLGNPKIGKQNIVIWNGGVKIGHFAAENVKWEFERFYHFTSSRGVGWGLSNVYKDFQEEYARFLKIIEAQERKNR